MPEELSFVSGAHNRSMMPATVIPVLRYPDAIAAATWLCRVFGFAERVRIGTHRVQMSVGAGSFVVAERLRDESLHRDSDYVMVRVRDVDEHCIVARAAGAHVVIEPETQAYGERQYTAEDLIGRRWTFSQTVDDIDPIDWGGEMRSGVSSNDS